VTNLFDQVGFDIRAVEAAAAVASAPKDKALTAFQLQAILLYASADTEMIPRGDVSEILQEIALRNDIAARAGGIGALQHILSEASHGRRALYRGGEVRREDFGRQTGTGHEQHPSEEPEIMWHGEVDPRESRPYLVQGLIPAVGTGLISGQWGTFKTFMLFYLSHCIMTGDLFLGCEIMRPGGVLLIVLEGNDEVAIRLQGVINDKGKLLGRAPFAWVETCPPLTDKNAAEVICNVAKRVAEELEVKFGLPLSLIGIDTMIAAAGYTKDGQENDAAAGQAVMNTLRQVARQAGCFVVGVDHFGKAVETGTRGSSAKEGAADVVLALLGDKSTSGEVKNTRLALRKSRGGANGQEFPFRPRNVKMGVDKFGKPVSTLVIDWDATVQAPAAAKADPRWSKSLRLLRQVLMNLLVDHGTDQRIHADGPVARTVNVETVRAEFYRSYLADGDSEAKKAAARRQAFNRAVNSARDEGVIGLRDFGTETVIWLATREAVTPGA
jgi:AAA domain